MPVHGRSWLSASLGAGVVVLAGPLIAGCTVGTLPTDRAQGTEDDQVARHAGPLNTHVEHDSVEISQSMGHAGGFVVLWPRIVPRTGDPAAKVLAERLQHRLQSMVATLDSSASVDLRPEPERVCPKTGCAAVSVGIILTMKGDACAAAALVSRPGTSPTRIIPWIGKIELKRPETPFRDPPESDVRITEFGLCKKVYEALDQNVAPGDEAALKAAIESAHVK